ncbi:MAG: anhydro-N-acetylmuramic acid kinase, partial [Pirellulales bacterium]|nr:anhydro-N-acetylmuramic acid kinase [Pirellulales bacterium]
MPSLTPQTSLPLAQHANVPGERRWAGLYVSSGCRRLAAAVVETRGSGLDADVRIAAYQQIDVADALSEAHAQFQSADTNVRSSELGAFRSQLVDAAAPLIRDVLADANCGTNEVLALAVHDPGVWNVDKSTLRSCISLCDAGQLASATGLNVIDAFDQRDLAEGGHGGPVLALPTWMLLRDRSAVRVLVDLGRSIRVTYLPSSEAAVHDVLSFDSGPGMQLLDRLTSQFTEGRNEFDPGGRIAVQGHKIGSLVDHWLDDRYFKIPPPRWHPLGVQCDEALEATVRMAVDS